MTDCFCDECMAIARLQRVIAAAPAWGPCPACPDGLCPDCRDRTVPGSWCEACHNTRRCQACDGTRKVYLR